MTDAFTTEITREGTLATVSLARPETGNKLNGQDLVHLAAAIRDFGADERVKAILVRAEGGSFCVGRDPGTKPQTAPSALDLRAKVTKPIMDLYAAIRSAPVPVVCLVQGEARGFGCAFATQCDITVASSRAVFSLPELEVNLPPTLAISALLHKVPPKVIAHLVYTRDTITAEEGRTFGIVSEVVEPEDLTAAGERVLSRLLDRPRIALGTIKEYLWAALDADTPTSARLAENMISVAMSSRA